MEQSNAEKTFYPVAYLRLYFKHPNVENLITAGLGNLVGDQPLRVLGGLMITALVISAFLNNTPVVAILTPVAIALAKRAHSSPSKLLIPLSYATVLGGMLTQARKEANARYNSKFVEVKVRMTPERRSVVQDHAASMGESATAFINRAIDETMTRDQEKKSNS